MSIFEKRTPNEDPDETKPPAKYNAPRPITASAAKINTNDKREIEKIAERRKSDKWQQDAWEYYDYVGEMGYAANLVANIVSRINIYPAFVTNSAQIPSRISALEDIDEELKKKSESIIRLLESGNGGISGMLRSATLNMFVAGECYLVKEPARFSSGEPDKYQIRSIDEVVALTTGRNPEIAIKPTRDSDPKDYVKIPKGGYVARLWRSHPRFSEEADSSVKKILDLCDELLLLGKSATATSRSRLNAGMIFLPDGLSNVSQSDGDAPPTDGTEAVPEDGSVAEYSDDESDSFEEELIDSMMTPIADVASASAVVPLVVRGQEDMGEKIKFFKFERTFDPQHSEREQKLLDRILSGLDIPKDVAAGLSNVKYSNGILIEEQLYKAHVEPLILMLVDCLTSSFLRPALRSLGFDEDTIAQCVVWYDPSAIAAKPSKAESATTGYEIGAISHSTWRRSHGFTDSDAPTQLEIAQRLAKEKGLVSEVLFEKLLNTMIPDVIEQDLREEQLAETDPESLDSLQDAIGDEPEGEPATEKPDIIEPDTDGKNTPPNLLEP